MRCLLCAKSRHSHVSLSSELKGHLRFRCPIAERGTTERGHGRALQCAFDLLEPGALVGRGIVRGDRQRRSEARLNVILPAASHAQTCRTRHRLGP